MGIISIHVLSLGQCLCGSQALALLSHRRQAHRLASHGIDCWLFHTTASYHLDVAPDLSKHVANDGGAVWA